MMQVFENFLHEHLARRRMAPALVFDAVQYSLFSGGKRFRPQVSLQLAEMLEVGIDRVVPFAAAVEMIHTYSLIHDDLPCMDNDDFRRGQPTNHRLYGEAQALLAGDALLTEAFFILADAYADTPEVSVELIRLLSEAAGWRGMVAGQVLDMTLESQGELKREDLLKMHALKTGALIRVAAEGVACIARLSPQKRAQVRQFGACLGLAFQLTDDILDHNPDDLERSGFPTVFGLEKTKQKLKEVSDEARESLQSFGPRAENLLKLIEANLNRTV